MHKQLKISWRTTFLFVLVWFIGATILLDLWPLVRHEGEWKTITNAEYGFSVAYPTKWQARTYGEHGFKGEDDVKLRIYRSNLGYFEIVVEHKTMAAPTLSDVITWGHLQINDSKANESLRGGNLNYTVISMDETVLNGYPVVRERYSLSTDRVPTEFMYERVFIARANDMIIIELQSEAVDFENYLQDFDAIVASFRPLD